MSLSISRGYCSFYGFEPMLCADKLCCLWFFGWMADASAKQHGDGGCGCVGQPQHPCVSGAATGARVVLHGEGKGRGWKGRGWKGLEGAGREGKGREGWKGLEERGKRTGWKGRERKGKEGKGAYLYDVPDL